MAILKIDNRNATLHAVILMIISGLLCALLSVSMQWYSDKMNYSIPQILFHISLFQLIFTLKSSMISFEIQFCPECNIKFSMNLKNTLNAIENMNDYEYIYSRRVSSSYIPSSSMSRRSSMVMHHSSSTSCLYQPHTNYLSFNHNESITPPKTAIKYKRSKISRFFIEKLSPKKIWTLILLRGIFGTLALFTYLESQKIINMVDSVAIKPLSIITSTIIGYVILADPLSKFHFIAVSFAVIGSLMIAQPPFIMQLFGSGNEQCIENMEKQWIGYVLAFTSSFSVGFVFLCIRTTSKAPAFLLILRYDLLISYLISKNYTRFRYMNQQYLLVKQYVISLDVY